MTVCEVKYYKKNTVKDKKWCGGILDGFRSICP